MHPYRFVVLTGVGFGAAAMLLPFASFPVTGVVDGLSADAWPSLALTAPVGVVVLDRRSDRGLSPAIGLGSLLLSALGAVFAVTKLVDAVLAVRATPGATVGAGGWVLLAATVSVLTGVAYGLLRR